MGNYELLSNTTGVDEREYEDFKTFGLPFQYLNSIIVKRSKTRAAFIYERDSFISGWTIDPEASRALRILYL